jgi:hypothetical protein
MEIKRNSQSYQERWRDWPDEARQPLAFVRKVLIPAERLVLEDKMKQKLLLIEEVFYFSGIIGGRGAR